MTIPFDRRHVAVVPPPGKGDVLVFRDEVVGGIHIDPTAFRNADR